MINPSKKQINGTLHKSSLTSQTDLYQSIDSDFLDKELQKYKKVSI